MCQSDDAVVTAYDEEAIVTAVLAKGQNFKKTVSKLRVLHSTDKAVLVILLYLLKVRDLAKSGMRTKSG